MSREKSYTNGPASPAAILGLTTAWLVVSCFRGVLSASAATIHVPADQPTIAAGIEAALNGDTVEVAPGTYAGFQVLELDFDGKDIVLRSTQGSAATVLDCQELGRAFHFVTSVPATARVSGFTIRNGFDRVRGGGILIEAGAGPTFEDCRIEDCLVSDDWSGEDAWGGGIYIAADASVRFVDCVVERCRSFARRARGGAMYLGANASARFELCTIQECKSGTPPFYGYGGAVWMAEGADLECISCNLSGNSAYQYGGHCSTGSAGTIGASAACSVLLDSCLVSRSGEIEMHTGSSAVIAHSTFHGVSLDLGPQSSFHLIDSRLLGGGGRSPTVQIREGTGWITSSMIIGSWNQRSNGPCYGGGEGGALGAEDSQIHMTSSVIAANYASENGAAILLKRSSVEIEACTITGNRTSEAVSAAIDCDASTVSIAHSILWDNCHASVLARNGSSVAISCSDVDPALLSPPVGITVDAECFSADPEFCRAPLCESAPVVGGKYSITFESPCRSQQSPCGVLIGALNYFGCDAPDTGGACCADDGTCAIRYGEECEANGGNFVGDGSLCDPNPCVGACCLDDGSCEIVSPQQCAMADGLFGGEAVCDPGACVGACCTEDGACLLISPEQCITLGGVFTAYGYACEAIVCVPPGACCKHDGSCAVLPELDCDGEVGAYLGDGTSCDPFPCDPHGACCGGGGECVQRTRSVCQQEGDTYLGDGSVCPSSACVANHNPGGVLLLHANPTLEYTEGGDYCGDSGVTTLRDVTTTTPVGQNALMHVLAAFPEKLDPNVSGAVFGIDYDASKLQISSSGSCGDWGYELPNWPAPQSGVYVRWNTSHTEHIFEVYWLAAYASEPTTLRLIRHAAEGGDFLGPPEEPTPDPITCFGQMGFGDPGTTCEPGVRTAGACCVADDQCEFLSESDCAEAGGEFIGYDEPCVPLPCAASSVPAPERVQTNTIVLLGPNPAHGKLRFRLTSERSGPAVVRLLGVGGTVVATLFDGSLAAGAQELTWTPTDAAMHGVYWIDARFDGGQVTRKLILVP